MSKIIGNTVGTPMNPEKFGGSGGSGGNVSAEQIADAVEDYFEKNPIEGGKGEDGYTPIKGVDYFTEADKVELAEKTAELIDVPTKTSQLTNDSGFLTSHQDISGKADKSTVNAHTGNADIHVTAAKKAEWDAKSNFSGAYSDLTGKPTKLSEFDNDEGYLKTDTLLRDTGRVITPYTDMLAKYGNTPRSALNRDGSVSAKTYNVWVSGFIPVKKGQIIRIKYLDGTSFNTAGDYFGLYDENKTLHSDYHITFNLDTITANATYGEMSISGNNLTWDTSSITYGGWSGFAFARFMLRSTNAVITIDEEITDDVEKVYEPKPTLQIPKGSLIFNVAEKPLTGKKIVCFGDSLFGRTRDDTSALYKVAEITGADVINVGFGGSSMAKVGSGAFAQFSLPALTDAIIGKSWTNQDANVGAATGWDEQLPKLKEIDFSTVDMIVLHYGTNDFTSANALEGSGVTSVCGALRYSLDKLIAAYPQIRFFISLPVYRYWDNAYPDTYTNSNGAKLTDFIEAIRKVAMEYNYPVIDGYHGMGVNKLNAAYYLADQTHHNLAGMKLFGEFIAAQLVAEPSTYVPDSGIDTDAVNELINAAIGNAIGGSY